LGATFSYPKEVGQLHSAFLCLLKRKCSIEPFELSSAISERRESLPKDPSREPSFRRLETLETLDSFQPSIELFVHALDEVRRSGAIDVEDGFCFDVGGQFLAALEDMVHRGNLHGVVLMTWGSPADTSFQAILPQVLDLEDVLLDIGKE